MSIPMLPTGIRQFLYRCHFMPTHLTPSQQNVVNAVQLSWANHRVHVVWSPSGMGKTSMLRAVQKLYGGRFLTMADYMKVLTGKDPMALEESLVELVESAWTTEDVVILDDFDLLCSISSCNTFYPRRGLDEIAVESLVARAQEGHRRLVFGSTNSGPTRLRTYGEFHGFKALGVEDYRSIFSGHLPDAALSRLDFAKVHRFAPHLNGHQLQSTCQDLAAQKDLDTGKVIDYLHLHKMSSNVDVDEVQPVDLSLLKGLDDVLRSLEVHLILPLENDELSNRLGLKPKRGVLLAGPPGTGKTTVGRALAHRLKSKFFMIDGTVIAGTDSFYDQVRRIFNAAKQNAPSIIFIDDGDVLFEDDEGTGLYRYLLTMLDGLESKTAGRVCVMMTAMNVGSLPPALIRSGRIELWLETQLPDLAARQAILGDLTAALPAELSAVDLPALAEGTEGLTGADLKRLMDDGKLLYAYDVAASAAIKSPSDYFLQAAETVRSNKARYEAAAAQSSPKKQDLPPWMRHAMGGAHDDDDDE